MLSQILYKNINYTNVMEDSCLSESSNNNKCRTQAEAYRKIKVLGQGSMGKAYLVESNANQQLYVMKRINIGHLQTEEKQRAMRESQLHSMVSHPNIIGFKEIYHTTNDKLCIIMQYAEGGDLDGLIKQLNGTPLSEDKVLRYFSQICLGLKAIHDQKIIHRDIKGANIFLTKDKEIKIGDFGISKFSENTLKASKTFVGTPYYLSPQMIQGKPYSTKADIWSLGVLLYHLSAQKMPFDAGSLPLLALKILKGSFPPLTGPYSRDLKNLILSLLQVMPSKRPNIKQILVKPLLEKYIPKQQREQIQKQIVEQKKKPKAPKPSFDSSKTLGVTKKEGSKKKIQNIDPQAQEQARKQARQRRDDLRKQMREDILQRKKVSEKQKPVENTKKMESPSYTKPSTSKEKKVQPEKKIIESPQNKPEKPWKMHRPPKDKKQVAVQLFVPSSQPKKSKKQQQIQLPPQNDFKVEIFVGPRHTTPQLSNQIKLEEDQSEEIQEEIVRCQLRPDKQMDDFQDMINKVNNAQQIVNGLSNKYETRNIQLYEGSETFDSMEDINKRKSNHQGSNQDLEVMKYLNNFKNNPEKIQEIILVLEEGLGQQNFIQAYNILKSHLQESENQNLHGQQLNQFTFNREIIRGKMMFLPEDDFHSYISLLYTLIILEKVEVQKNFESDDSEEQT